MHPVISIKGLTKTYAGGFQALRDVAGVRADDRVLVNGAPKRIKVCAKCIRDGKVTKAPH